MDLTKLQLQKGQTFEDLVLIYFSGVFFGGREEIVQIVKYFAVKSMCFAFRPRRTRISERLSLGLARRV